MKDQLNQLVANVKGQFIEVSDKNNVYQCMDLAYLWVFVLGIPKATIQRLYAYQVYTNPSDLTKEHFELFVNTPDFVPQAGDLAVWDNSIGIAGHIAICTGIGDTKVFEAFEQNNPLGSYASFHTRSYVGVIGFLRPKKFAYTIPVLRSDFENMRTKCDKYDALVALGYGTVESIDKLETELDACKIDNDDSEIRYHNLIIDSKTDKEKALLDLRNELLKQYQSDLLERSKREAEVLEIAENKNLELQTQLDNANLAISNFSKLTWTQLFDIILSKLKKE